MNDYRDLWDSIRSDLSRAEKLVSEQAPPHETICRYYEFIEHNELGLACDALEDYAKEHLVPNEFWQALRDASIKMQLWDNADRYEKKNSN